MGTWIKSQDKKRLVEAKTISVYGKYIYANNVLVPDTEEMYGEYKIGEYESEERAIEILEDITTILSIGTKVIKMPEK